LVFDGREYIDAPNYPVDKRWAEQGQGYGYHHNASFRTAILGQAGLRTYFQPSGGVPADFTVQQTNIPLQAYGAEEAAKTDAAKTDAAKSEGGKYDAAFRAGGEIVGILGSNIIQANAAKQQAEAQAKAQAEAAKWAAVSGGGTQQQGSSGVGTVAIVGILAVVGLGAAYFLFKDDKNDAEDAE
jgi:cobalamin biosynthesis Mg chelatase CobN